MKTRTMNAKVLACIFLTGIFALSGFSQATGPPDDKPADSQDNFTILTKSTDKKNCIDLKINPNPIRNSATIEFTLEKAVVIQIGVYNLQGEMVLDVVKQKFEVGKNRVKFTPSKLPTGTYYVCVSCSKKRGIRRVVII